MNKPVPASPSQAQLGAEERVAVILSLLDPDQAKSIAAQLEGTKIPRIIESYRSLGAVPKPILYSVMADFITDLRSKSPRVWGGDRQAARLSEIILESDDPNQPELLTSDGAAESASLDDPENTRAIWAHLEKMDPSALTRLIAPERPSIIATILSRLPEDLGGQIMANLPESVAIATTMQMAQGSPVSAVTMDVITESLRQKASDSNGDAATDDDFDPLPRLTAILNRCPASRQSAVLTPLRAEAADHAAAVESGLVRFDTLADNLPRNAAPILFRELEESQLHCALRYGATSSPEVVEFLYANISQRLAQQIREKVDSLPAPSEEDGENAQAVVIAKVLEWVAEDRFALTNI